MTRAEKWQRHDEEVGQWRKLAPAFIQEIVTGLWSVQTLCRPPAAIYSNIYRRFMDPPAFPIGKPHYDGWPGDHRGWLRFESKEAARDFYKFATKLITFEEYQKLPHSPLSFVRIDLDDNGDFVERKNSITSAHRED